VAYYFGLPVILNDSKQLCTLDIPESIENQLAGSTLH